MTEDSLGNSGASITPGRFTHRRPDASVVTTHCRCSPELSWSATSTPRPCVNSLVFWGSTDRDACFCEFILVYVSRLEKAHRKGHPARRTLCYPGKPLNCFE